jgi:DNA polymerase-3 subunit delta'
VPEEEGCAGRLFAAAGVDRWMEVWDKVSRLTDQAEGLNLDRKQVVINLFTTMAGAVRA